MTSGRDLCYESSTSTTECSSSCPSPSTHMSQFGCRPNNAPKYGTMVPNRIFVGGLPAGTTEMELLQLFSAFGNVKTTKVINDRAGVSKGYGFVTFETEEEAQRLVQQETLVLNGRKLNIGPAVKKQPFNPVLGAGPLPANQPGCHYIPKGSPCWYPNGVLCFMPPMPPTPMPQMPPSHLSIEPDTNNMVPRNDPVYHNTMLSNSATGMLPVCPYTRQPMYFPTPCQYSPMPPSIDFPFGTPCVSPLPAGIMRDNVDYHYEVPIILDNDNSSLYNLQKEEIRDNKRRRQFCEQELPAQKRNLLFFHPLHH